MAHLKQELKKVEMNREQLSEELRSSHRIKVEPGVSDSQQTIMCINLYPANPFHTSTHTYLHATCHGSVLLFEVYDT